VKPGSPEHKRADIIAKVKEWVDAGKDVRQGEWKPAEVEVHSLGPALCRAMALAAARRSGAAARAARGRY
jgi:hypothetical protein